MPQAPSEPRDPVADSADAERLGPLHERLLAALLGARQPPAFDVLLLGHAANFALLVVPNKSLRIYLLAADQHTEPAALRSVLDSFVARNDQTGMQTYFVVSGGRDELSEIVKQAAPRRARSVLGFYHLRETGELLRLGRAKLALLEGIAPQVPSTAALTPAAIDKALAAGQAFVQREQAAVSKLRGSHRVTLTLTLICVLLMGLAYLWSGSWNLALYRMGANSGAAVRQGEVWRLLSSAFLHGNILHLALNMYALWGIGTLLEALLGPKRYLILYAVSALGGSLASAFIGSDKLSVGASGAIWGLMAGALGLALRPRGVLPSSLVAQLRSRLLLPLAANALYSFQPGVDFLAHLGGGVVGFVLVAGVLTRGLKPLELRRTPGDVESSGRLLTLLGAVLAVAAMTSSLALGLSTGRPWAYAATPVLTATELGETGLTLQLPVSVASTVTQQHLEDYSVFVFGTLSASPMAFEVMVAPLASAVPDDQLEGFLQQVQQQLQTSTPPTFKLKGTVTRVTLSGKQVVYAEYAEGDVTIKSHTLLVGNREVMLRSYALATVPLGWKNIEQKVVASIAESRATL